MASGLSRDEEAGLLYNKLSDPAPAPSSGDTSLYQRLSANQSSGNQPGPSQDGLFGRLSGGVGMAAMGVPGPLFAGLAAQGLARHASDDDAKPFETAGAGFAPKIARPAETPPLQPMPDMSAPVQPAPALNPALSQIGRPMGGGAPGGMNPLHQRFLDAQAQQLGTLGQEQGLTAMAGMAKEKHTQQMSELESQEAGRQKYEAISAKRVEDDAASRFQANWEANQKMADELARSKPDPGRLMASASHGMQFTMAIGAVAGGMLSALNGGPNQFLEHLDKIIDRDVAAQNQAIENKRSALGMKQTMLSQFIQQTGDRRLGASQYRQMLLEAAKSQLKAQDSALGIPEQRAGTQLAVNALQQKIDGLNEINTKDAWKQYQAQAAAAEAQRRAAEERAFQHELQVGELGVKVDNARTARISALRDGKGDKDPTIDAARAFDVHTKYLADAPKDLIGVSGDTSIRMGGLHTPWQSDARGYGVKLDKYNQEIDTIVGHWAKDEEGKIPVEEFKRATDRFELKKDMPDEEKRQRIEAAKQWVDERAKTKGVGRAGEVTPGAPAGSPGVSSFRPNGVGR